MSTPVVAVVGRPNVGKSTLVNRIAGRREAIVQEKPGVTRDRVLYDADWAGHQFLVADSGGLDAGASGRLERKVDAVARATAAQADVILMVVDVQAGITPDDREVADMLRRLAKRVLLVANKADNATREADAVELYELGLGEPVPVSALHGRGVGDLLDEVCSGFDDPAEEDEGDEPRIAIVGRPNAGKSSLFNRLVGGERSIVHDEPGTTRDSVDSVVDVDGQHWRFVDTAGMRRVIRVDDETEYYGVVRTTRALERCDVALVVVDVTQSLARQDLRICEQVAELGRSAVLVITKADAVAADVLRLEQEEVRRRVPHLGYAPLLVTSAHTGRGVSAVVPTLRRVLDARGTRVPTPLLNAAIEDVQARTPVPSKRAHTRVKYAVQAEVSPPRIVLFGAGRLPTSWLRHLERALRERFGFEGTPIMFSVRGAAPRRGSARRGSAARPRSGR